MKQPLNLTLTKDTCLRLLIKWYNLCNNDLIAMEKIKNFFKNIKFNDNRLLLVVVIVILVLLMMDFNNRMTQMLKLNQQRDQLSTQVIQFEQTKQSYEEKVIYATSERALEEWAREKARMVETGDVPIIVLTPAGQQIIATPVPQVTPESLAHWEIWQELFFGD